MHFFRDGLAQRLKKCITSTRYKSNCFKKLSTNVEKYVENYGKTHGKMWINLCFGLSLAKESTLIHTKYT